MNALQEALRAGRSPADLSRDYSIAVRQHPEYPELYLFKYSQIDSLMHVPIVQAARGIILDASRNWEIVCWTYNKFFNAEEPLAAPIDWASAVVLEKLDGSLLQMYHYAGRWHVASSGLPDAGGEVQGHGLSFADLFWKTFEAQGLSLKDLEDDDGDAVLHRDWTRFTFAWELTSPLNRVVVAHDKPRVTLIGIRDRVRGTEYGVYQGPTKWPKVRAFPMTSYQEMLGTWDHLKPTECEGYVVVDRHWNRVKVKHPGYVALHHLRGNGPPTAKRALEAFLTGEKNEILAHWPEWRPLFEDVEARFNMMVSMLAFDYQRANVEPDLVQLARMGQNPDEPDMAPAEAQKLFAREAVKSRCSSALFSLRAGKVKTINEYLRNMSVDRLADLLEIKTVQNPALD